METTTLYHGRRLNARPDTIDFRDKIYTASLIEVPSRKSLSEYKKLNVPILDQGEEGACTGFGLATLIHFLKHKSNGKFAKDQISPRMLYEMAKKYDEWDGEDYVGSSARGAMKGWHKHGVCKLNVWPYDPSKPDRQLTQERIADAANNPLGAYYRVNHKDIVDMHCALTEVGILYATARVHDGWFNLAEGEIPYSGQAVVGGHAFAIVAYDEDGFWIQNSWGEDWGTDGFALITYDDWLANGTDAWVARLGAPVKLMSPNSVARSFAISSVGQNATSFQELRPHVISLGNDGALKKTGTYGNTEDDIRRIFNEHIPTVTKDWKQVRIMFYAHGGLNAEKGVLQMLSDWKQSLYANEIYPIFFIWHSDLFSTLRFIIEDSVKSIKSEQPVTSVQDFMLDRIDDFLEPILRKPGRAAWNEMKENALRASDVDKGASFTYECFKEYQKSNKASLHLVAHSAGAIFMGPLVKKFAESNIDISTCTLWAPACTMADFDTYYSDSIENKHIKKFSMFTLTADAELDDNCLRVYNKSLLYLVSNSFEDTAKGTPILGMIKYIKQSAKIGMLIESGSLLHITSPNGLNNPDACRTNKHGGFNDDVHCLSSTVARIVGTVQTTLLGDAAEPTQAMPEDAIEAGTRAGETYLKKNRPETDAAPSPDAAQLKRGSTPDKREEKRKTINSLLD